MKQKSIFEKIPGVGPSLSRDFLDLGYQEVSDLQNEDPEQMFNRLCLLRGKNVDRCVLYVFREAVYFAGNPQPEPKLLKWWNWKDSK